MNALAFSSATAVVAALAFFSAMPTPAIPGTCIEEITWGSGPSTIDCLSECSSGCETVVVNLPPEIAGMATGTGAICNCAGSTPSLRCCRLYLVPPSSESVPVPYGSCGTSGCAGQGACTVLLEILSTEPLEFRSYALCLPTTGG